MFVLSHAVLEKRREEKKEEKKGLLVAFSTAVVVNTEQGSCLMKQSRVDFENFFFSCHKALGVLIIFYS